MIIDTNIIILYLNGDKKVINGLTEWKRQGRALFISSITVAEVLSLPNLTKSEIE
ncbi:hypothetical protein HYZ76_01040 [Candidatus Falkowbacteria bacterium]|nr:hypothetical protein [Candidatus Falkowbacteria bacterium]